MLHEFKFDVKHFFNFLHFPNNCLDLSHLDLIQDVVVSPLLRLSFLQREYSRQNIMSNMTASMMKTRRELFIVTSSPVSGSRIPLCFGNLETTALRPFTYK